MSPPSPSETQASAPSTQGQDPINDPDSGRARDVLMPSETPAPTRIDTEAQQASTQPGDGGKSHVPISPTDDAQPSASPTEGKIPWKDQVLGYAKVTRGKMLGKQDTASVGHKILQGEIVPQETRKTSD